jgi:hypothetical protein
MVTIQLNGREIPLEYTTMEMLTIQEEIGSLDGAIAMCCGRNPEDSEDRSKYGGAEHLKTLAKMVKILGNAGIEIHKCGEADLTVKKVLRGIRPDAIYEYSNACMECMFSGLKSEIPKEPEHQEDDRGRVDIGLEEMRKKDEAEG